MLQRYFKIIAEQKHPVRFLFSRLLMRSGLSVLFVIKKEGYKLKFYPSSLSAALWVDSDDRHADERFLKEYLQSGDIVIDVGANIGSLTLAASDIVGESGKVYAVEANPKIFSYLRGNLLLNQKKM
jgi:hypothetical protein